jgi:SAM-dependent methyltransferase
MDLRSLLSPPTAGAHEFVGTDLNPAPFPKPISPTVTFTVQDIKEPWPESQYDQYDLVHQCLTLLGAGPNPSASISHLFSIVKPGGWIHISEGTMDFPIDVVNKERTPAYYDMLQVMRSVAEAVGAE